MISVQVLLFGVDLLSASDSGIILQAVQSLGEHTFECVHPQFFEIFEFLFNLFTTITLSGSDNMQWLDAYAVDVVATLARSVRFNVVCIKYECYANKNLSRESCMCVTYMVHVYGIHATYVSE